ncbi:iron-sulfur cluster repair di-iron protein, ric [Lactobacillus delbrueckii]|uniref:Iron-sulfur cluster repair di-iron protein, ric n=1 Tax=Lactobacillus delbrueckii subsp. lactis TaxID=29397 RepID=A0ABD4SKU7_LACDL|nr:iron-sulfur cluster repair di-iron protein, ric [Lactobacillus delbrueckii]MCD5562459.1 iron-sulfur cluster repair di-iron protein, ric [Lactobacillus delbrueckii subsp. lactis]MCD5564375.1 iron-sulfur cluster repair di-iron protein, ric [Lactobacillus delbrueckii subsp. lactis]MCD5579821.1 iron-sulfur cluster repair di-iron protein, ric [Lactobacillus delbrueckii subsp. lactis]
MMIKEFFDKNDEMLDLYTQAITKAYGDHHPEVFEVRKVYEDIQKKVRAGQEDLTADFSKLRSLTADYTIPADACGAMTKTYQTLEEFDHLVQG